MDSGFTPTTFLEQLSTHFHLKVGEEATLVELICPQDCFDMKEPKIYCDGTDSIGTDHVQMSIINEEEHTNERQLFKRKYKLLAIKKGTCYIKFPKDKKTIEFTITE